MFEQFAHDGMTLEAIDVPLEQFSYKTDFVYSPHEHPNHGFGRVIVSIERDENMVSVYTATRDGIWTFDPLVTMLDTTDIHVALNEFTRIFRNTDFED